MIPYTVVVEAPSPEVAARVARRTIRRVGNAVRGEIGRCAVPGLTFVLANVNAPRLLDSPAGKRRKPCRHRPPCFVNEE